MKRALFVCALGILAASVALPAHADTTYSLQFSGCFGLPIGGNCFGQGFSDDGNVNFTIAGTPATPSGFLPNSYDVTAFSGDMTIGSHDYAIGSTPATGLGGDNQLDLYENGVYDFDPLGIDFTLSSTDGGAYDEFRIFGPIPGAEGQYSVSFEQCTGRGQHRTCTPETYQAQDLTFAINGQIIEIPTPPSSTPEPGSLALLGTAILGGAGALRRRFRA